VNVSPEALLAQAIPLQRNDKYGDAKRHKTSSTPFEMPLNKRRTTALRLRNCISN